MRRFDKGMMSDHFDGQRYFNPGHDDDKRLADILRWKREANPTHWPTPTHEPAPTPAARIDGGELAATLIGHSTFLLQTRGLNILTDPFFSNRASPLPFFGPRRIRPPALPLDQLPPIDVVLVSHNHYDHMDMPTLKRLARAHDPLFVTPTGNEPALHKGTGSRKVTGLDWGQQTDASSDTSIALEQAYHWSSRALFDRRRALWGAFIIKTPEGPVYFAGDTGYRDGAVFKTAAQRHGPFRLALLPIGAYEPRWFMAPQHMNPDDAVRAHIDLGRPNTLAMHFGTIQLTDEGIDQPLHDLATARETHGITPESFAVPSFGRPHRIP